MFIEEEIALDKIVKKELELNKLLNLIDDFEIDAQVESFLKLYDNTRVWAKKNSFYSLFDFEITNSEYRSTFNHATLNLGSVPYCHISSNYPCYIIFDEEDYGKNYLKIPNTINDNVKIVGVKNYVEILKEIKDLKNKIKEFKILISEEKYNSIVINYKKGFIKFNNDESIKSLLKEIDDFK